MRRYILRRLLIAGFILVFLSIITFVILRIAPGDPAVLRLGPGATEEQIDAEHERLGLNEPFIAQYFDWVGQILRFDLGESNFNGEPVLNSIRTRLPTTIELMALTLALTTTIGILAGVLSALYRNSALDYVVRVTSIFGLSVPAFWVATLVLIVPNEQWGYAPPIGKTIGFFDDPWDNLRQFGPPALVLALGPAASVMRLTRSTMLEVLRQDYVRTARSKGLRERVVVGRHALKNAMIPVVTVLGLQFVALLGGSVIIESIFTLNGIGRYFFQAIFTSDYQVVQTLTLYIGAIVVLTNLGIDILYAWLDPRIKYM